MQDLLVYRNEHLLENCRKLSKKMNQLVYDICYIVDMEGKFKIPEAEATAVHKELNHFDRWYSSIFFLFRFTVIYTIGNIFMHLKKRVSI